MAHWQAGLWLHDEESQTVEGSCPFRFASRVLRWIFSMLMRGRSMYKITQIVNRAGVPSPWRREVGCGESYVDLTNPALKGVRVIRPPKATSKDVSRIVYDSDGHPIRLAPPIFTDEEFDQLQDRLKQNAKYGARKGTRGSGKQLSRFLGVIQCGNCQANIYKHVTKKKRKDGTTRSTSRLRCSSYTKEPCGAPSFDPDEMYGALADTVLDELGDYEVIHREYARGAENLARVTELQGSIKHYMDGLVPGGAFAVGGFIQKQAEEALQKLGAELSGIDPESTQDSWHYRSIGVTYREHWSNLGIDQMEKDLLRGGITFLVHTDHCDLLIPDDVKQRLVVKDDYFKNLK
ncbi:recombinase family protein [Streptomyces thioluteus]